MSKYIEKSEIPYVSLTQLSQILQMNTILYLKLYHCMNYFLIHIILEYIRICLIIRLSLFIAKGLFYVRIYFIQVFLILLIRENSWIQIFIQLC